MYYSKVFTEKHEKKSIINIRNQYTLHYTQNVKKNSNIVLIIFIDSELSSANIKKFGIV